MLIKISVVIIAKNAQETIVETLQSLSKFDEVILYLNNSTDRTSEIAQQFSNVTIIEGDFLGFGPTKNKAASYSKNSWILSLDSDEVIPDELSHEINTLTLQNSNEVFTLKRDNYFLGKKVKYSGWGQDFLIRIYNKNNHSFNENMVHESIQINDTTINTLLTNSFKHNAIENLSQQLQKTDKYSEIYAKEKRCKKYSSPLISVLKALFFFIKTYLLKLGILDGYIGFLISVSGANGVFYKYIKLYEENKKCKKST